MTTLSELKRQEANAAHAEAVIAEKKMNAARSLGFECVAFQGCQSEFNEAILITAIKNAMRAFNIKGEMT